jgi:hypothetical protein
LVDSGTRIQTIAGAVVDPSTATLYCEFLVAGGGRCRQTKLPTSSGHPRSGGVASARVGFGLGMDLWALGLHGFQWTRRRQNGLRSGRAGGLTVVAPKPYRRAPVRPSPLLSPANHLLLSPAGRRRQGATPATSGRPGTHPPPALPSR